MFCLCNIPFYISSHSENIKKSSKGVLITPFWYMRVAQNILLFTVLETIL
jgi:hypothetical protein